MSKAAWAMWLAACAVLAGEAPIKVGKPVSVGGEAVSVKFRAYTAKVGPDEGIVLRGQVLSRLPHKFFKVQVTIQMWDVYRKDKYLWKRGSANVVFEELVPNVPKRWEAVIKTDWNEVNPFAKPDPIYTVIVQFVKQVAGADEAKQ